MEIATIRNEFTTFVVEQDPNIARGMTETLKASGYEDTRFFPTLEAAMAMIRHEPPHVLLLSVEDYGPAVSEDFLEELNELSPEILVICVIPASQSLLAVQWVSRSIAYDFVVKPFVSSLEIVQKMDRGVSRLYYQFESEQLREHYQAGGEPIAAPTVPVAVTTASTEKLSFRELAESLERLRSSKDLEQTISIFLESLSRAAFDAPVIYFKYLPNYMSLLFSQSMWLPSERFRGIGVSLKDYDAEELGELLEEPEKIRALHQLVYEVFKKEKFTAFTHSNDGEILGVVVVLDKVDIDNEDSQTNCLRYAFDLAFKRNVALKEKYSTDTRDAATGLVNRRHFHELVEAEIARSRRIRMPVCLVLLSIDGFAGLKERVGQQQLDAILKTMGQIIKSSARKNDIIARTAPDEIALLLPHTAESGGAIRAERLRRVMESTKFPLLTTLGLKPIVVSCGVSAYPTLCGDADGLIKSADEALQEVRAGGGNKTCVALAPMDFQMDFTPTGYSGEQLRQSSGEA